MATLKDLYTYALYKLTNNNDITYISDYETTEDIAEELKASHRTIQRLTYKTIEGLDFESMKESGQNYIIIKEQAAELLESITEEQGAA